MKRSLFLCCVMSLASMHAQARDGQDPPSLTVIAEAIRLSGGTLGGEQATAKTIARLEDLPLPPPLDGKRDQVLQEVARDFSAQAYSEWLAGELAPHFTVEEAGVLVRTLRDPVVRKWFALQREHQAVIEDSTEAWRRAVSEEYFRRSAGQSPRTPRQVMSNAEQER